MRQLKITPSITNRDSQSLDLYLNDISKIHMITADDEVVLTQLIRQGDQVALHRLTRANLRFVVSVAKKFQNQGLSLTDLISEGNLGLIKAAKRFDETKGFKFISYAVWWIRQGILQAIAEQSRLVRLPLNQIGTLSKISKAISILEQEHEREPSVEELAEMLEKPTEAIADLISKSRKQLSIDAPLGGEQENSLMDVLAADVPTTDDELIKTSLSSTLKTALASLSERERNILILLFGIDQPQPCSLEEISDRYGLSRERVRQLKDKAIKQLSIYAKKHDLIRLLED